MGTLTDHCHSLEEEKKKLHLLYSACQREEGKRERRGKTGSPASRLVRGKYRHWRLSTLKKRKGERYLPLGLKRRGEKKGVERSLSLVRRDRQKKGTKTISVSSSRWKKRRREA